MRLDFAVVLLSFVAPALASAQQLLFDESPGQVLDSIPVHIGMPYDEALAELGAKYEPIADRSATANHTVLRRRTDGAGPATLNVVAAEGRVIVIGSDWTPEEASSEAFAERLVELFSVLAPPQSGPGGDLDCRLSRKGGGPESNLAISELACGRHMIHVVRYRGPDGAQRSSLQLVTR